MMHGGDDGSENSGKIWLDNGKKDNFKRGRTDNFHVETSAMLSPLHHLTVGHDNSGLGAGFYCEKVSNSTGSPIEEQVLDDNKIRSPLLNVLYRTWELKNAAHLFFPIQCLSLYNVFRKTIKYQDSNICHEMKKPQGSHLSIQYL